MPGRLLTVVLVICLCLICLQPVAMFGLSMQDHRNSVLAAKYKDKLVTLRTPYCGQDLEFDAQGKLVSGDESVNWQTCQLMWIRDVHIEDSKLKVKAHRISSCGSGEVHNTSDPVAGAKNGLEAGKTTDPGPDVSIEVQLSPHDDEATALDLMDQVFSTFDADRRIIPPECCAGNGITAPIPIYQPDPNYSDKARQANYEGTVVLAVVVGPDGRVHDPRVSRSLGMGLDEKAIEKVKTWRFKPATRCGKPVPIQIKVEITFKLD